MGQSTVSKKSLPFALIKPVVTEPRSHLYSIVSSDTCIDSIRHWWEEAEDILVVDLETTGLNAHDPAQYVVGVSFADKRGAIYIDVSKNQQLFQDICVELYKECTPLAAHNVSFDAAWMTRYLMAGMKCWTHTDWMDSDPMYSKWIYHNWRVCTLAAYKHLASEGFEGQSHGLKALQVQVLGWQAKGDVELDEWMMQNDITKGTGKAKKADKGRMYLAPYEILGKYGCMDTDSTWQFWTMVLKPLFDWSETYAWYHHEPFMSCVTQHVRQQFTGMQLDRSRLTTAKKIVTHRQDEAYNKFFEHERVAPQISTWNLNVVNEHKAKEPTQFLKGTVAGVEPTRFNCNGTESKVWKVWQEKSSTPPVVSKNWLKWKEKLELLEGVSQFNLNSSDQCRWLFYTQLNFEPIIFTKGADPKPATGKDALVGFGELGKMLKVYKDEVKLLGSVDKYLERMDDKEILRVQMRIPGTLTGRLSGTGGINIQQVSNDYEVLNAFKAREGCKLIISDFAALEPVCLTDLSGDPALLNVYGKDAPPGQDLYLYNGAQTEGIKHHFLSLGYTPLNPTKESIKACKEHAKKWRNVAKCLSLSSIYGASPGRIRQTLALQGVELSLSQVKLMHSSYWQLYSGTKKYEKYLISQWEKNKGWVLNGIGRPVCLDESKKKDIINRVVQGTGHDCLLMYLWILRQHLEEENIPYAPFIWDLHDAVFLDVPEEFVPRCVELINTTVLSEMNHILNPRHVKFKIVANVVNTFAEDKIEKLQEAKEDWDLMEALVTEEEDTE